MNKCPRPTNDNDQKEEKKKPIIFMALKTVEKNKKISVTSLMYYR
jgi:hypothetical protein